MRILIGYNGNEHSHAAIDDLRHAGLPDRTEALVLTIADMCFPPENICDAATLASLAADKLRKAFPTWTVKSETGRGNPAREILVRSESFRPDLIVIGQHANQLDERNLLLGQVTRTLLTDAACTVRLARRRGAMETRPERIIVGFDGSPGSELAVRSIAERNWPMGTQVCLLAVADASVLASIGRFIPQMNNAVLEAQLAWQWAETLAAASVAKLAKAGLIASVDVRMGHPRDTIIEMAEASSADCIFVGSHCSGNSVERFLLGNVTVAVTARAHCSVEIARKMVSAA